MMKRHTKITLFLTLLLCFIGGLPALSHESHEGDKIAELLGKAEDMLKADPSKAIYYANAAMIEAQKRKDGSRLSMSMGLLGEAYMNQGDFGLGFEALTNAIEHCPKDSAELEAYLFIRLSNAYMKLHDLDQAFLYVDKAARIYESVGDSLSLASCYNSRGLVYILVPDNLKAEENFRTALSINRQLKAMKVVAANLNNLCLYEGNPQEKIDILHEAIAINDSLGAVWSLGENYNNLGTQYFYAKEYDKALEALHAAMKYARQIHAKELISDNYRYTSWVYEAQKNYSAAYINLKHLYTTEQELLAKDEMRQIELNMIQKRLHAKEQEMTMQGQAFQIKNLKMQRYLILLLSIAILFILLYVTYHYRQKKRIQILESAKKLDSQANELIALQLQQAETNAKVTQQELDYNCQQLTNFAFFVRSRNDLLANIQSMIKESYRLSGAEQESHLRSINTFISQFNAKNTETELLIDQINGQFIDKLSRLHPDLSRNEQRMASLLRIGLSTKEIASVIDSNPKTVNMARYRLRKRLNLESDDSLTEYMKNI